MLLDFPGTHGATGDPHMSKINRDDFRETLTLLLSAHIASQAQNGLKSLHDARSTEDIMSTASKLAIKIIDESKKYPKKKSKKDKKNHPQGGLIAIRPINEIETN
jgi:hypothetical protein